MKDNYKIIIQQQTNTGLSVLTWTQFKCSLYCHVSQEGFVPKLVVRHLCQCITVALATRIQTAMGSYIKGF